MIRQLGLGVWVCLVTVGAAYGAIEWQKRGSTEHPVEDTTKKLAEIRTKPINVPIIADGMVQGFIVAQFVFTADSKLLDSMPVKPEVYLLDEAFKSIYAGEAINFRQLKRQDLPKLAKALGDNVNKRLGAAIVHDVLIDQLSYVPKSEMRGDDEKKKAKAAAAKPVVAPKAAAAPVAGATVPTVAAPADVDEKPPTAKPVARPKAAVAPAVPVPTVAAPPDIDETPPAALPVARPKAAAAPAAGATVPTVATPPDLAEEPDDTAETPPPAMPSAVAIPVRPAKPH